MCSQTTNKGCRGSNKSVNLMLSTNNLISYSQIWVTIFAALLIPRNPCTPSPAAQSLLEKLTYLSDQSPGGRHCRRVPHGRRSGADPIKEATAADETSGNDEYKVVVVVGTSFPRTRGEPNLTITSSPSTFRDVLRRIFRVNEGIQRKRQLELSKKPQQNCITILLRKTICI